MKNINSFILLLVFFVVCACANPGVPTGGEKDEDPPRITKTSPENYAVKFDEKRIIIDFNEFVKLQDAFKNVVISPPQKKSPKVRLKEKQIVIDLRDTLRPNTTYTIDFGKAIVDNNEGNLLGEYRYVFSTGEQIDKMGLAGYVKGAKVDTISEGATVALYAPSDTLNPYQLLPEYIAKTDTLGFFMFNNIVDKAYKIIAFQDENSNNMLDPDEPLAFKQEAVHTSITDSGELDSIQLDKYTKFKNANLQLRIFKPISSQQYLKEYNRPMPEQFTFVFNAPRKDSLTLVLLNTEKQSDFFVESNEQSDSLIYWIADKEIAQQDTLLAQLSYLRTDSLGDLKPYLDTLKLTYKESKKEQKEREKSEKEGKINFMKVRTNMSGKINYFDMLTLTFERPIPDLEKGQLQIFTKQDTIETAQEFSLERDSLLGHRKYHVLMPLEAAQKYNLRIDSMQVYDSAGRPNQELKTSFETYDEAYYGRVFVTLSGGEEGVLLQLADKQKPDKIIVQKKWQRDGKIIFEKLPPATYVLKALWDMNGNQKWDVGDYTQQRQPERVQIFNKEIKLPSNWELEVSWTLKEIKDEN